MAEAFEKWEQAFLREEGDGRPWPQNLGLPQVAPTFHALMLLLGFYLKEAFRSQTNTEIILYNRSC